MYSSRGIPLGDNYEGTPSTGPPLGTPPVDRICGTPVGDPLQGTSAKGPPRGPLLWGIL